MKLTPSTARRVAELLVGMAGAGYFPDARPEQQPPEGEWATWLILAGRGYGKTRTGAEWLADIAQAEAGSYAIAAPTYGDGRDVCVEGPGSGLLAVLDRRSIPHRWNRSLGEVHLTAHGSRIKVGSADEPDRFRGWNFSGAWCDELASWRYADAFVQLRLATRLGSNPRIVVTTTPRPTALLRELLDQPSTVVTRGRTWDNAANLAPSALEELERQYGGSRLGRQELEGELLDDVPNAQWQRAWLDRDRIAVAPASLDRIVVAVDPAVTATAHSDETGIIVAGRAGRGNAAHGYVLDDRSCVASPGDWGRRVCLVAVEHQADAIVYESNQGGDMVAHVIRGAWADLTRSGEVHGPMPRLAAVRASRGKATRAEPVAAQWEQGRWHIVGSLPALEDQMVTWVPGAADSPDRVDALVWACTELLVGAVQQPTRSNVATLTGARLPPTSGAGLLGRRAPSSAALRMGVASSLWGRP